MPPHGMAVTGTDCTQMPGIGRTFSGYLSMITSSIRVACRNSQFRGTHKFLRVHHVFEETLLLAVCAGQSQRHARRPGWHSLVTVSPTRTNAHAHPSLRSLPSGHGEFNIIDTSLTSGQSCLSASTRSQCPVCGNLASVTYSTMYRPRMFARCAVFLVSAVLYPRTTRQPYSYCRGIVISLTEYTVNSLHQILHSGFMSVHSHQSHAYCHQQCDGACPIEWMPQTWAGVTSRGARAPAGVKCHVVVSQSLVPSFAAGVDTGDDWSSAHTSTMNSSLPSHEFSRLSGRAYNLGVIVQPGCEANHTCEQDNLVWYTFYGKKKTVLVWLHKYRMNTPCWCDKKCKMRWTIYGVNKMSMVWSEFWWCD